jgi:hypothetical protein
MAADRMSKSEHKQQNKMKYNHENINGHFIQVNRRESDLKL